jgi:hypothetical protein
MSLGTIVSGVLIVTALFLAALAHGSLLMTDEE